MVKFNKHQQFSSIVIGIHTHHTHTLYIIISGNELWLDEKPIVANDAYSRINIRHHHHQIMMVVLYGMM